MVILEPLSTTDESTLFRKMAPPCNVCCPLPTSVAPSSSLTRSQSDGAQVTIGACGITEATCVGRWPGQRAAEMHSPLGCLACFGRSNCTAAARSNNSPTSFSVLPVRRRPSHDRRMRHHKASWSCILLLDALCLACFGWSYIVLPLPDPVAPLRFRSCSAATTPPF